MEGKARIDRETGGDVGKGPEMHKRRVDSQERNPHDVLQQAPEELALAEAVLQEREAEVARPEEHDRRREPDLERVQVEAVHGELEPEQDVVDDRDRARARYTVCVRVRTSVNHPP